MGNSCLNAVGLGGREFVPSEGVTGQDEVAYEILLKIISKKQVDKMWSCYCEIDADQSGSIRDDEFRAFFKLEKGAFNQKLFGCFDADHSGYLNFFEFTCAVSVSFNVNYCIPILMIPILCHLLAVEFFVDGSL